MKLVIAPAAKEDLREIISRAPGVAELALIAATGKGRTIVM